METATGIILDNLRAVNRSELECKKDIARFNLNASIRRSNSAYFLRHADDAPNQDMERIDRMVSQRCKDEADIEERYAGTAISRLTEIMELKQRWLDILERSRTSIENPQHSEPPFGWLTSRVRRPRTPESAAIA